MLQKELIDAVKGIEDAKKLLEAVPVGQPVAGEGSPR